MVKGTAKLNAFSFLKPTTWLAAFHRNAPTADPLTQFMHARQQAIQAYGYDVVNRWNETDQWKFTTSESANQTDTPFVRRKLRDAARFERRNNSYCAGVTNKVAYECVGTGPRLEIEPLTPSDRSRRASKILEQRWREYAQEINFTEKLMEAVVEEIVGGEVFSVFRSNYRLKTVQVDWVNFEADQFSTPYADWETWQEQGDFPAVDGIRYDRLGNVLEYHKLRHHPGGHQSSGFLSGEREILRPEVVCHLFRKERPSQFRGVSHLAPCIELFGKLRRYTEAVIGTAEQAASLLGTIETAFQPDLCNEGGAAARLAIGNGTFMPMPDGWKANPFKAEQPTTAYGEFKQEILHEIFSCLLMPWNVASGDSSDYNFASGRLDYLIFYHVIDVMRNKLERQLLNRFLDFWLEFATFTPGIIPTGLGAFRHRWYWDKREPIDQVKSANAAKIQKESGLLDERSYWQDLSVDPQDAIDNQLRMELWREKRRIEIAAEMGVTLPATEPAKQPVSAAPESRPVASAPKARETAFAEAAFDESAWTTHNLIDAEKYESELLAV